MASPFPVPVSAAQVLTLSLSLKFLFGFLSLKPWRRCFVQVGTYFVGQYFQVLQQQPELVHQFYSDESTVLRVDGNTRETATAMLVVFHLSSLLSCSFWSSKF